MSDPRAAELLAELLAAVKAERAIELGSRGKPWDDDDVWPVYLLALVLICGLLIGAGLMGCLMLALGAAG